MQLKYAKMVPIVMHRNMKLGDNTLNNERLSLLVTTKLPIENNKLWPLFYPLTIYQ